MPRTLNSHFFALAFALLYALAGGTAHAVQRTHVSAAFGADANTATGCTAAAPCRFFQAALTVTDANGEVVVLDSGGYGAVTITQSVSLIAPTGVYAGISVFPGATGVTIATGGVNVTLRGLTINGQGGNYGINMTNGASLTVENCLIANMGLSGIVVDATVAGSATARVTDTTIRNNGIHGVVLQNGARATVTQAMITGNGSMGVFVNGTVASTTTADVAGATIEGNGSSGIFAQSATTINAALRVSVRDSRMLRHQASSGASMSCSSGAVCVLSASNNLIAANLFGISASGAGVKVWASANTVSDNGNGAVGVGLNNGPGGSVFQTAGNNAVNNNTINKSGTITVVANE